MVQALEDTANLYMHYHLTCIELATYLFEHTLSQFGCIIKAIAFAN